MVRGLADPHCEGRLTAAELRSCPEDRWRAKFSCTPKILPLSAAVRSVRITEREGGGVVPKGLPHRFDRWVGIISRAGGSWRYAISGRVLSRHRTRFSHLASCRIATCDTRTLKAVVTDCGTCHQANASSARGVLVLHGNSQHHAVVGVCGPRYSHPLVHVSWMVILVSPGSANRRRCQIHSASTSLVGFSRPATSFRWR